MFKIGPRLAQHQSHRIQQHETFGAYHPFQRWSKEVKRQHVEQQMRETCMHQAARYHRVVLLPGQQVVWPEQARCNEGGHGIQAGQADADGDKQNEEGTWRMRNHVDQRSSVAMPAERNHGAATHRPHRTANHTVLHLR